MVVVVVLRRGGVCAERGSGWKRGYSYKRGKGRGRLVEHVKRVVICSSELSGRRICEALKGAGPSEA